jgi:hypothetical protein
MERTNGRPRSWREDRFILDLASLCQRDSAKCLDDPCCELFNAIFGADQSVPMYSQRRRRLLRAFKDFKWTWDRNALGDRGSLVDTQVLGLQTLHCPDVDPRVADHSPSNLSNVLVDPFQGSDAIVPSPKIKSPDRREF